MDDIESKSEPLGKSTLFHVQSVRSVSELNYGFIGYTRNPRELPSRGGERNHGLQFFLTNSAASRLSRNGATKSIKL